MNFVIFDTEYTSWEGSLERNWSNPNEYQEIVQIGAYKINQDFEIIDKLIIYVKPKLNNLSDYFTNLTCITNKFIDENGITFKEALEQFYIFCKNSKNIFMWGYDDKIMMKNIKYNQINNILYTTWIQNNMRDIKLFFNNFLDTKNYNSGNVYKYFKLNINEHKEHNALNDCYSIYISLKKILKNNKYLWFKYLNKLKIYSFIFARGGSKGIKNKNIKIFDGKPLINYSIDISKKSKYIDKCFVSTDCEDISNISKENGAEVPFLRPKELAEDNSAEIDSWKHIIKHLNSKNDTFDIFISIPTVCPFKSLEDINSCIEKFIENDPEILITTIKSKKSPYHNLFKKIDENNVCLFSNQYENTVNRQSFENIIYENTNICYISKPEIILYKIINKNIWTNFEKIMMYEVDEIKGLDLDTELDWNIALYLLKNNYNIKL